MLGTQDMMAMYLKVDDLVPCSRSTNHHDDLRNQNDDKRGHHKDLAAVLEHGLHSRAHNNLFNPKIEGVAAGLLWKSSRPPALSLCFLVS